MTMRAYGIDYFLNLLQCEGRCGIADGKYVIMKNREGI